MNILVFNWQDIKNPQGGGAEVHFHEIFRRIAAQGHNVDLYCCSVSGMPGEEIIDGINVHREGSRNTFNYLVPKLYKKATKAKKYDIVIDDVNKIPFYTPLYVREPLLGISHHFFGKSIFEEAGLVSGSYVYLAEKLMPVLYNKTPFAVVSESTLYDFKDRGFDTTEYRVIKNAITQSEYPMEIGKKNAEFTITYFGRLKKYKSVQHLISAFSILNQEYDNLRLDIIGKGDYRDTLEKQAKDLGISEKTTFHGFVDEKKKIELLSNSHVVVNTSMKEGWGITNIEANACGTPVVVADVPGLRDSLDEGVSGLKYQYAHVEGLSNQIEKLITDNAYLKKLSQGALLWAATFDWDDSAKQMLDMIKSVINVNRPGL
jgi:glycosyltransferase involved in cell wall biosynthesis